MGGPGEKQIESDRRQITERINRLNDRILRFYEPENLDNAYIKIPSEQLIPRNILALIVKTSSLDI